MHEKPLGRLQAVAVLLGALSVVMVLGVSVTAAVVQHGDESAGADGYAGWSVVRGTPGPSDTPALYRVPHEWETQSADEPVRYTTSDGSSLASGHSSAFYYGNDCSRGKTPVPGGWTAMADTDPSPRAGDDLVATAENAVRVWAEGYATNAKGTTGQVTASPGESVQLDDGTTAGRARMEIDMTVFTAACLPDSAEMLVTSIETDDGVKSLVQARYLLEDGEVPDEQWDLVADSLHQ